MNRLLALCAACLLTGGPSVHAQVAPPDTASARVLVERAAAHFGGGTRAGADSALVLLEEAVALAPDFEPALDALAHVHWVRTDRYGLGAAGYVPAVAYAERVRALNPSRGWYLLGQVYGLMGEHAFALDAFHRALEADPEHTRARHALGYRHFDLGQHDHGIPLQARVALEEPENRAVRNLLGFSYFHIGRPDRAEAAFRESIALRVTSFSVGGLLVVRLARGDLRGAVAFTDSVRQTAPDAAYAWARLGEAHFFAGDDAAATRAFEEALARDSLSTNIYTWMSTALPLAHLYARSGRLEEAARMRARAYAHSDAMMRRGQEPWNAYYHYAALALQEGSREQALRWLRAAHAAGMPGPVLIEADPLFAAIREDAEFREIVARLRWREREMQRRLGLEE